MTTRLLTALLGAALLLVGLPSAANAGEYSWADIRCAKVFKHTEEINFTVDIHVGEDATSWETGEHGLDVTISVVGGPKDRTVFEWEGVVTESGSKTFAIAPQAVGSWYLYAHGYGGRGSQNFSEEHQFKVAAPLKFTDVSAAPKVFYPYKRDGYRDITTMKYRPNREARIVARVKNSNGKVVRKVAIGLRRPAVQTWTWNGKTAGGRLVKPGKYRIFISGTPSNGGAGATAKRAVEVRRG
jgi:hypothetical protein